MKQTYHIEAAVACPVDKEFSYSSNSAVLPGCRIRVPFGRRSLPAVTLSCKSHNPAAETLPDKSGKKYRLKPVDEVVDETPVLSPVMLRLGRWLSQYYMHPLGEVFRAMTPAAVHYKKSGTLSLTEKGRQVLNDPGLPECRILSFLFARKSTLSKLWLTKRLKDFPAGFPSDPCRHFTVRDLLEQRLVYEESDKQPVFRQQGQGEAPPQKSGGIVEEQLFRPLNEEQEQVFQAIQNGQPGNDPLPCLLRGVTGAGKTEVYLHLIRSLLQQTEENPQAQALLMVPEISLTPQTTSLFEARFPGQVAVVHSGLSDKLRWQQLERVRSGEAGILIGPRSSVFAPFQNLKLIIVDEEHDHSYKQQQGFRYNGRDVAVLRGTMEKARVLLGSATPSLESLANARQGRYQLLEINKRAGGQALPGFILAAPEASGKKKARRLDWDFSPAAPGRELPPEVREHLEAGLKQGQQAIVLVNRRGYSGYVFDPESKEAVACPDCSISMTLHKARRRLICHYCSRQTSLDKLKREHPDKTFLAMGQGSQKTEEVLQSAFPFAKIARLDSDITEKKGELDQILGRFRAGELDILTGTQMLAKGHDFPNVTLTILLETDQMLSLPDFRAGERVFQLLVQAAGRSGRGALAGKVVLETGMPEHEVIQAACNHDYHAFADQELEFRQVHLYPPYGKMILFEISSPSPGRLAEYCDEAARICHELSLLHRDLFTGVKIQGPTIPAIEKINGRFRRIILFSSANLRILRQVCRLFRDAMPRATGGIRLNIDVDPQSLI